MNNDANPLTWAVSTWVLAILMGIFGGLINLLSKYSNTNRASRATLFFSWLGELFVCGFVGLMVFFTMTAYDQPLALCAVGAAIGGHWSSRLVFLVDRLLEKKIEDIT